MKLRTLIFWPHLIAGVVAGAVILLMSVTGVLLTYERQMIAWSDSHLQSTPASGTAARLPLDALVDRVQRVEPAIEVTSITTAADRSAPVVLSAGPRTLYVDAYDGRVLGEPSTGVRGFMSGVRGWHRWFAAEDRWFDTARAVTGWSNIIFLFIVATGIYLWFPKAFSRAQFRAILWFRRGLPGKARDFNWHNVIGFWTAVPLFFVVLTAVPISFTWATTALYRMAGDPPQPARGPGGPGGPPTTPLTYEGLTPLWVKTAERAPDWRTIRVRVPRAADETVVFSIDRGLGGQPQWQSILTFDRATAREASYETFADRRLGQRLRSIARFGHTGEVLGLSGQTIAGIVSAGAVVMVWTGIALSWRRYSAWLKRRRRVSVRLDEERAS